MSDDREWARTERSVGNDGLAAVAIALITLGLIAFVIVSLV
ncbi:MAG: hypothetical protein AAGA93_26760 [Actinomycetota bacterium]